MKSFKDIRFSLSLRLIAGVVFTAGIIYLLTIRYINYDFENVAVESAKKQTNKQAEQVASRIENIFDADYNIFRTYAQVFEEFEQYDPGSYRNFFNRTLEKALMQSERYYSTWDNWELRFVHPGWDKPYGRVSYAYYREGGFIMETIDTLDIHADDTASLYYKYKVNPSEGIAEPYKYSFSGSTEGEILMTSIIVPIMKDSTFVGMVGADIGLDYLNDLIDSVNSTLEGYSYMLSQGGNIIAHADKSKVGKNIQETDSLLNQKHKIVEHIRKGEFNSFVKIDYDNGNRFYTAVVPVTFGKTNTSWGIAINMPLEKIVKDAQSHFAESRKVGIYGLLFLVIVVLIVAIQIIRPIKKITKVLDQLSRGEINTSTGIKINTGDEIEQMSLSVNEVVVGFRNNVEFADAIKNGNFDKEFKPLSEKDVLGNAILEMRDSLKRAKAEEAARQEEDRQSNWASQGINLFGGILRQDNDDLEGLAMRIISALIEYLNAHQGGLYVVEGKGDKQYLELLASVGFDKEKMAHKTIMPNEGNVGRCLLEKLRIYMDDIPKNYPPVLSGLGQTKPGSALVVPMLINEVVVGIIEIGSLRRLQEFEIEFVEKIAVSIASTISSAKVNARTAELLEKSKEQADELSQQEEEMRQNMEELQAMQEEATKRELQIENFIKAAKSTLLFVEYDMDANITDINNNMLNLFQLKRDQVVGKKTGYYEFNSADKKDDQELIWDNLRQGKSAVNVSHSKYSGKEIYLKEYYYPLRNENGKVYKVVNIAFDITEEKRKEDQLAKLKKEYEQLQRNKQTQAPAPAKPEVNINDVLDDENYFEYVDLTHLRKVYKNDLRKIQNIISIYVDTIPKQIRELIEVSKRDMGQLKSKINNFKTKMSYLGLMQIVDMAKEVEAACNNNGETSEVTDFLDEIMDVWEEAEKELRSIIVK